jgi:hypothetical protein
MRNRFCACAVHITCTVDEKNLGKGKISKTASALGVTADKIYSTSASFLSHDARGISTDDNFEFPFKRFCRKLYVNFNHSLKCALQKVLLTALRYTPIPKN